MKAPDELNERQTELLAQVNAGELAEEEPDTDEQLLRLAQLGHLHAEPVAGGWHFTPAADEDAEPAAEPEPVAAAPELTERQQAIVAHVEGQTTGPTEPATHDELLELALGGHVLASRDADGWHFLPKTQGEPPAAPTGV